VDPHEVLRQADLGLAEVRRRAGGTPATGSDAVRQRFAALLGPVPGVDEPASGTLPDDARHCGALVVRLGEAATATAIAAWMGWTLERTGAAVAEVDRRLDVVGLQLVAEAGATLVIRDRVRARVRPRQSPLELLAVLDDPGHRHAVGHLVRGDQCATGEEWAQPLFDLGVAVPAGHPGAHPCEALGEAFAGVRRRAHPQIVTVIGPSRR
jgi:hypothetical protein